MEILTKSITPQNYHTCTHNEKLLLHRTEGRRELESVCEDGNVGSPSVSVRSVSVLKTGSGCHVRLRNIHPS